MGNRMRAASEASWLRMLSVAFPGKTTSKIYTIGGKVTKKPNILTSNN